MGELRYYTGDVYKGSWKDGLRHGKVHALHIYMYMILSGKKDRKTPEAMEK